MLVLFLPLDYVVIGGSQLVVRKSIIADTRIAVLKEKNFAFWNIKYSWEKI